MAETNPTPEPTPQDDQGSTDKDAPDPTTKTVPLSALEKERKQRQELAAKLEEIERKQREAEMTAAEKAKEYEAKYSNAAKELERYRAREDARRTSRYQALPEATRNRIAERWEDMGPDARDAYLDAWEEAAKVSTTTPDKDSTPEPRPGPGSSDGTTTPSVVTEEEKRWIADNRKDWRDLAPSVQRRLLDRHGPNPKS